MGTQIVITADVASERIKGVRRGWAQGGSSLYAISAVLPTKTCFTTSRKLRSNLTLEPAPFQTRSVRYTTLVCLPWSIGVFAVSVVPTGIGNEMRDSREHTVEWMHRRVYRSTVGQVHSLKRPRNPECRP